MLHGAPSGTIRKQRRVQNNDARIVQQAPRRSHAHSLLKDLHWLPVEQRVSYKLALLTFKIQQTSAPAYLSRHIRASCSDRSCSGTRSLRSSAVPLLDVPFRRTDIGKRSFSCAAPTARNSLPPSVINCDNLSVFKPRLKITFSILHIVNLRAPQAPTNYGTTALYKYFLLLLIQTCHTCTSDSADVCWRTRLRLVRACRIEPGLYTTLVALVL